MYKRRAIIKRLLLKSVKNMKFSVSEYKKSRHRKTLKTIIEQYEQDIADRLYMISLIDMDIKCRRKRPARQRIKIKKAGHQNPAFFILCCGID